MRAGYITDITDIMGRLIFHITEAQRQKLEDHRHALGLASIAAALRDMIDRFGCAPLRTPTPDPRIDQIADGAGNARAVALKPGAVTLVPDPKKGVRAVPTPSGAVVPLAGTFTRPIYQKGQKR